MNIVHALILGIVQGLTEFIPVSSSGHLVIIPVITGWELQSTQIDIILHGGTLLALLVYFKHDLLSLLTTWRAKGTQRLVVNLGISTIPAALIGYLWQENIDSVVKSPLVIASALAVGGLLMIAVEKNHTKKHTPLNALSYPSAGFIGAGQALALIRGMSRSGITIVAGMASGLSRTDAARYAFLLGIPIIGGSFIFSLVDAEESGRSLLEPALIVGFVSAFLTGLFAIRFLLNYLKTKPLYIFAYYRFALAGVLFILAIFNYV